VTIEIQLGGRRFVEDRDTAAVLSGSKNKSTVFAERWTLSLDGSESCPWRLAAVGDGIEGSVERASSPSVSPGAGPGR
jgi:predicted lipid-binding transport protein (Tim44 family)